MFPAELSYRLPKMCIRDRNKDELNIFETIKTVNSWLKLNRKVNPGREWGYLGGRPRVIIEKLIKNINSETSLTDYKMYCLSLIHIYIYAMR